MIVKKSGDICFLKGEGLGKDRTSEKEGKGKCEMMRFSYPLKTVESVPANANNEKKNASEL